MPVEAKTATPRPAPPSAPEAPKPRSNWEVYRTDHMPPGKSLTEAEAAKLPSGDYSEKPLYLVGNFVVAMVHKDRAILWPDVKRGPVSIVVSYPLSIPTPQEATRVVREANIEKGDIVQLYDREWPAKLQYFILGVVTYSTTLKTNRMQLVSDLVAGKTAAASTGSATAGSLVESVAGLAPLG